MNWFGLKQGTLILIVSLLSCGANAIDNYNTGDMLSVFAVSGMNLRDAPKGNVLQKLPFGTKVRTLEAKRSGSTERIEGISGNWVRVSYNNTEGYIFDGFLSRLPAPSADVVGLEDYSKRYFKSITNYINLSYLDGFMGASASGTQLFMLGQDTLAFGNDYYYEGSSEYMSLTNISMEEGYLLLRALFKESYEQAIRDWDTDESGELNPSTGLKGFILNGQNSLMTEDGETTELYDHYICEFLPISCSSTARVSRHGNRVFILIGGGC